MADRRRSDLLKVKAALAVKGPRRGARNLLLLGVSACVLAKEPSGWFGKVAAAPLGRAVAGGQSMLDTGPVPAGALLRSFRRVHHALRILNRTRSSHSDHSFCLADGSPLVHSADHGR
jgi:hypothetical protein